MRFDACAVMQGPAVATAAKKKGQEDEDAGAPLKASSGKEQRFRDEKNLKVQREDVMLLFVELLTKCMQVNVCLWWSTVLSR